jgi:hypothetical protein
MNRRAFILGAAGLAMSSPLLAAQVDLGPPTAMGIPRRAWVAHPQIVKQNCPQWCWAASASMIFASHNRRVPQEHIVARAFGGLVCAPSPTAIMMAHVVNDTWVNGVDGQPFQSHVVAAYDHAAGHKAITNSFIIDELMNDRPLLYANTHHAMVVVAAEYFATPSGPNIQNVGVIDPWPGSPDFHPLSPPETVWVAK